MSWDMFVDFQPVLLLLPIFRLSTARLATLLTRRWLWSEGHKPRAQDSRSSSSKDLKHLADGLGR